MNRQQRRAAAARERKTHEVFYTKTFAVVLANGERHLFWFKEPDGFTTADSGICSPGYAAKSTQSIPASSYSVRSRRMLRSERVQRLTLLGPQCEVSDGGVLHSARRASND